MTQRHQSAFTLLEMLLVLAIIVAVAALAVPSLQGPLESSRLRKSADMVRGQWARARNIAIRTGRLHVFYYQLNGNQFMVQSWYAEQDETEASGSTSETQANKTNAVNSTAAAYEQLPDRIQFYLGQTAEDGRVAELEEGSGQSRASASSWAAPIVFYPDGTTSTARVILTNESEQFVVIDLRGLTGISRVSDVLTDDELPK